MIASPSLLARSGTIASPEIRRNAVAFVIAFACTVAGFAADSSFEPTIVQRLRDATKGDMSGVAVLIAREGKIVYQDGFGYADVAKKIPITVETKFRIGSVTKQFTAAAVLRLAEDGKLALTDLLAKYFPDIPGGNTITLRHLLTHTSGIHSFTEKPEFMTRVTTPIEPAKLIEWFQNDPPDFAPGTGFHYNNSGYFLLGEIVAKVSGKSYGDFLRETFFDPLGMKSTGVYANAAPPTDMALGYSFLNAKLTPALDWDMSWAGGAGALYSTVGDLFRWNEALFGARVFNDASFKAATTPIELPAEADGMKYGFGLIIFTVKGLPAIGHGGGLNGWSSDLLRLPEQHCTVVALSNALPPLSATGPTRLNRSMAEELLADEIKNVPAVIEDTSVAPKIFDDYAGKYESRTGIITVSVEGAAVFVQVMNQPKLRALPKGKDEFFFKTIDAQILFARDAKGQVVSIRQTQDGQMIRAARMVDAAVALTTEQLDAFVGQYQYGPAVMTVTRDGTQLFAQLSGQPKMPIFAKSENEFEWHVVKAAVTFVNGDDGKVAKAVHSQNGRTLEAPRVQ